MTKKTGGYRASMYAELQKFGRSPSDVRQLALTEPLPAEFEPIQETGLDLSVSEDKALCAIQILLAGTEYKGNIPGDERISSEYKWSGLLPKVKFTPSEYLEAYGLKKGPQGTYSRAQRDEAMEALRSLTKTRRIIYKRTRWEKNKKVYDVIIVHRPLIELIEDYRGLEEGQVIALERDQNISERQTMLAIQASPLLMDGIENFYLIKPPTLHRDLEEAVAKKRGSRARVPPAYTRLLSWLLTKRFSQQKIHKDRLVTRLRLETYRAQRKIKKAYKQIDEALELALELGYLLSYEEDCFGTLTLVLNPEKCSRIKHREEQEEEDGDD